MLRYIGLLLLIPLLDMLLLVALVPVLGLQLIVLLTVLTALLGMFLARLEGRHTLAKIQQKLARGDPPTDELVDGGLLIVAGAFFLTPGLVTDAIALLFIVPITRYPIRWALKRWVIVPYMDRETGGFASGNIYVGGFPPVDGDGQGSPAGGESGSGGSPTGDATSGFGDVQDVEYEEVDGGE